MTDIDRRQLLEALIEILSDKLEDTEPIIEPKVTESPELEEMIPETPEVEPEVPIQPEVETRIEEELESVQSQETPTEAELAPAEPQVEEREGKSCRMCGIKKEIVSDEPNISGDGVTKVVKCAACGAFKGLA